MTAFDLSPPSDAQRDALVAGLSADERRVLLQHGTEAPFCGVFLDNKQDGVYGCRLCGLPLFRSSTKFDSGTGWPSFFAPFDHDHDSDHSGDNRVERHAGPARQPIVTHPRLSPCSPGRGRACQRRRPRTASCA